MSTEHAETDGGADQAANDEALRREWERWREKRTAAVAAPYGPLAVTGTHWIADAEEGALPGLPGSWAESGDGEAVLLEAGVADGLAVDDELLAGQVLLGADGEADPAASRVSYGERRLLLIRREGQWAVRVFDPEAPTRRAFTGIDAFPYDPAWVRQGAFRPYEEGERSVRVGNADGQERGLGLAGQLVFTGPEGEERTLQVAVVAGGGLWAVLADGTSGRTSYPFRFLRTGAPRAGNAVTVDFNRTTLPPCAFTDNFLCPFPPPGNRLPFDVPAGERRLSEG